MMLFINLPLEGEVRTPFRGQFIQIFMVSKLG